MKKHLSFTCIEYVLLKTSPLVFLWIKNKMVHHLKSCALCLFLSCVPTLFAQTVLSNEMIWQGKNYASFTSLVYYKGYFYCSFRNANQHSDLKGNDFGSIKIIRSKQGDTWEEYLSFSESGYDFRDPQLSITPDNVLMLLTNKVQYKDGKVLYRQTCSSFIDDKHNNSPLSPIEFDPVLEKNWLWNVEWIKHKAYGFIYTPCFAFVESQDGIHYRIVNKIDLDDTPTEASLIKKWRKYVAVVRRSTTALVGVYKHKQWVWFDSGQRIECPKLIKIRGVIYLLGRYYGETKQTALFELDEKSHTLNYLLGLPCKTDCGYPGVVYKNKVLYISYYSGDGQNSDIYFAKVKL